MRGLEHLHPKARELAELLQTLCRERGLNLLITDTWRSEAEQTALYAKGRTAPGGIVTNCKYPLSPHNWGVAFDFCKNVKGHEYDDTAFFKAVGALAKTIGLFWGGDFKSFTDMPHLEVAEYLPNNSVAALRKQYGTPEKFKTSWEAETEMSPTYKIIDLDGKKTAAQWLGEQSVKPTRLINGSMLHGGAPVGTVICDGKVIHDAGQGVGFGIRPDGTACFGRPYSDGAWRDHVTGHPGLIWDRRALSLADFARQDPYVCDSPHDRTVVYQISGNIFTDCFPACTLDKLQQTLLAMGAEYAINMDGGGSCFLAAGGVLSGYRSGRVQANLIAEYGGVIRPTLRKGSKGADVTFAQKRLNALTGAGLVEDGDLGTNTDAAVRTLQRGKGLGTDGIIGYKTWSVLEPPATATAPKTPEELTVDNALTDGIITDRAHWLGVLTGSLTPSRANIKAMMDNAHLKIGG